MDESLFKDDAYLKNGESEYKYNTLMEDIENEVDRSEEEFIKHYYSRYSEPYMPPSWMTLEVVSFGSLSRLYELLVKDDQKNADYTFLNRNTIASTKRNKLFAYLCCIKYILDIVSPDNDFLANLQTLISQGGPLLSLKDMGFPDNWKHLSVWK